MNGVSLFAGVGGIDLALERAGINVVAAVEIDKAARGVIRDRFPDVTLFNDVTKVTGDQLRDVGFVPRRGIVAAGWPCQGNSVAGRRQGMDDTRSGLWVHVARLLVELRPAWFLGENVPGLLSVNDGRDMATVLADLADCGMGFAWRVLDAQHFGVPQRRRRVFIVGCAGDWTAPVQILLEPESGARDTPARSETGTRVAGTLGSRAGGSRTTDLDGHGAYIPVNALTSNMAGGGGGSDDNTAQGGHLIPCLTAAMGSNVGHPGDAGKDEIIMAVTHALTAEGADASEDGTGRGTPLVPIGFAWQAGGNNSASGAFENDMIPTLPKSQTMAALTATAVRRLTPLECERLQGFPDGWTAASDGKPQTDSARYRQLGNAVAVPVVEWVARRIVAHHQERVT